MTILRRVLHRLIPATTRTYRSPPILSLFAQSFSTTVKVEHLKAKKNTEPETSQTMPAACGTPSEPGDDEDDFEEMFVNSHPSLGLGSQKEWGGPTRGGKLAEPTRFGDWERKGRCSDF